MAEQVMTDAVRVAFVSSHAKLGGSERYLSHLLEGLGPEWIAEVVVLDDGPFVGSVTALLGRPPRVVPTGRRAGSILVGAWRLRRALFRRETPDVVHANGVKAALVCALASIGSRVPVIWVKHDFSWDGPLGRAIASRCRLVVGVSASVLEGLRLPPAKARVVYSGLPERADGRPDARTRVAQVLGVPPERPLVLLVGRLHPAKGQIELIETAPGVLRRIPDALFVLLGGSDDTTPAYGVGVKERARELDLGEAVTFVEYRDDADRFIEGADVVVIPSVRDDRGMGREGFSLVGLESMMTGTPIVAYADGALPEILGDCAAFAPPGDRGALGDEIVTLLKDESLRARLTECGKQRSRGTFGFSAMIDALKWCYRAAADRRGR
ncbi:MAG: glycosyltransferase family 4 protein [Actinomycetota bacterium]